MIWLESNPHVTHWASECICIPYYYVVDKKTHHYYPDYFVEFDDGRCVVVEIKPSSQTKQPMALNEDSYSYREYIKNRCKWKAAVEFCKARGYDFKILTEHTVMKL